jgi:hypothetical protein
VYLVAEFLRGPPGADGRLEARLAADVLWEALPSPHEHWDGYLRAVASGPPLSFQDFCTADAMVQKRLQAVTWHGLQGPALKTTKLATSQAPI